MHHEIGAHAGGFHQALRRHVEGLYELWLHASYLLVESLLEGSQVSLEGYVSGGRVHVMGILDAVMFPGAISFRRFQYPSALSSDVQDRMEDIAQCFLTGIGYDNAPDSVRPLRAKPRLWTSR